MYEDVGEALPSSHHPPITKLWCPCTFYCRAVIMFDPMYDSYVSMARRAGAIIRPVRLALPDFSVPIEELTAAFSDRTKAILVNTPHNPSGKVCLLARACLGGPDKRA